MSPQVPNTESTDVSTAEVATVTAPTKPAAKKAKAAAKKPAAKKPAAKKAKAAPKASNNGHRKDLPHGINGVQAEIVSFLAKHSNRGYSLRQVADGAGVSYANLTVHVGSLDEDKRRINDKKFPCLITLGLIKYGPSEDGTSGTTYMISAKGKMAAARL